MNKKLGSHSSYPLQLLLQSFSVIKGAPMNAFYTLRNTNLQSSGFTLITKYHETPTAYSYRTYSYRKNHLSILPAKSLPMREISVIAVNFLREMTMWTAVLLKLELNAASNLIFIQNKPILDQIILWWSQGSYHNNWQLVSNKRLRNSRGRFCIVNAVLKFDDPEIPTSVKSR
jgi:hypothetical protein